MSVFGNNLRRIREEAGLLQEDLAARAMVPRSMISQWETGARARHHPHIRTLHRLAAALGCLEQDLISPPGPETV